MEHTHVVVRVHSSKHGVINDEVQRCTSLDQARSLAIELDSKETNEKVDYDVWTVEDWDE